MSSVGTTKEKSKKKETGDAVDRAVEGWMRERPDLDPKAMEVVDRIQRIASLLAGGATAALAPLDLGRPGYAVLAALLRAGEPYELTPTELTRAALLTSGAMTHRIDRLEEAGLVRRVRPEEGDRRSIRIRLTEEGRTLVDEAAPLRFAAAEKAVRRLSRRELAILRGLLHKLAEGLEAASGAG